MKIAANLPRVENLDAATSLRQALALCSPDREGGTAAPKHWPPPVEANAKLSKFVGYVERFPVKQWPAEQQDAAREKLLPVAQELWPDRFA